MVKDKHAIWNGSIFALPSEAMGMDYPALSDHFAIAKNGPDTIPCPATGCTFDNVIIEVAVC